MEVKGIKKVLVSIIQGGGGDLYARPKKKRKNELKDFKHQKQSFDFLFLGKNKQIIWPIVCSLTTNIYTEYMESK